MAKYVRKFLDYCITCKLTKQYLFLLPIELHPILKVEIPWHTIHIDITGKLSGKTDQKEYIIVQLDAFTKFVYLHHTVNVNSERCIDALKATINVFGVPTKIIADQGRCFTGSCFKNVCAMQKI